MGFVFTLSVPVRMTRNSLHPQHEGLSELQGQWSYVYVLRAGFSGHHLAACPFSGWQMRVGPWL